jgi:nucleoside-diphosphate-sugar epimerase
MKALVTGAAGFIGSHLTSALAAAGHEVVGLDVFTDYYDVALKEANAEASGVDVRRVDLRTDDIGDLVADADVVFHLAAQPGVRLSWAEGFAIYDAHNVLALQRVLEAVAGAGRARDGHGPRLVFASSSSVYGNADRYPCSEGDAPHPHSPYGVTKLAGEHLCAAYAENFGVQSVALRYFTVYGPRQRPDMAFNRMCAAVLAGTPFPLFGDGTQVRDFTYVGDVVAATIAAGTADVPLTSIVNVAGGSSTSMKEVFDLIGQLAGRELVIDQRPPQPGDVRRTGGDTTRARELLGWQPTVRLEDGLAAQLAWHGG